MKRQVAPPQLYAPLSTDFVPPKYGLAWAQKLYKKLNDWAPEISNVVSTTGQNRGETPSVASAATLAVTAEIMHVTGTAEIDTLTVPANFGGAIELIPEDAFTLGTSGNIAIASTAVVGKTLRLTFSNLTQKWYPSY